MIVGKPVGIDLGTYNSAAAYKDNNNELQMAGSDYGGTSQGKVFPSFVKFNALGEPERFGEKARLDKIEPSKVVWGVKRIIGKKYEQIQPELSKFLYDIQPADKGVVIPQGGKQYTPTDISSKILGWIKECLENGTLNPQIGSPVDKAVITYPAHFDEIIEKPETAKAAEKAGFSEVRLITEPEAAALSYGVTLDPAKEPYIMVIDWGAGTLDVAIHQLRIGRDGKPKMSKANAPGGDLHLGGIDMDDRIVEWVINSQKLVELASLREQLKRRGDINLHSDEAISLVRSIMSLNMEAQEAKIELSSFDSSTRIFPYRGGQSSFTLTRNQFEQLIEPLLIKFTKHILWMITEASLTPADIKAVLLVGGPMKMPCTRRIVRDVFSTNKNVTKQLNELEAYLASHEWKFPPNIDPMECVAKGAALYAEQLWGDNRHGHDDRVVEKGGDITAFDYGILFSNVVGQTLIKRGMALPAHGDDVLGGPAPFGIPHPVSIFKKELNTETFQYQYVIRGDYNFYPSIDSMGHIQFYVSLDIPTDGPPKAFFKDNLTGSKMTLYEPQFFDAEIIPEPPAPRIRRSDEPLTNTFPPPQQDVRIATAEMIESVRRKGKGHLIFAKMKLNTPDISTRNVELTKEAYKELEQALDALPPQGAAPFKKWQDIQNGCEQVRNRLQMTGLLSKQEEAELSIDEIK
jgi:molecular chaperone DnaK (HSP70)